MDKQPKPVKYIGTKIVTAIPMKAFTTRKLGYRAGDCGYEVDGYEVCYADGYKSWSPKDVFDKSYNRLDEMSFGDALEFLKLGEKVARKGWNGKGIFIKLQRPDRKSKMTSPYIYINTTGLVTDNPSAPKSLVPWLASQTDMLASDWMTVD